MDIETILKNTVLLLDNLHILGSEAGNFYAARQNLIALIDAIKKARGESIDENQNEQGD